MAGNSVSRAPHPTRRCLLSGGRGVCGTDLYRGWGNLKKRLTPGTGKGQGRIPAFTPKQPTEPKPTFLSVLYPIL